VTTSATARPALSIKSPPEIPDTIASWSARAISSVVSNSITDKAYRQAVGSANSY
jgi:hypothetical protein